jgi:hypothetical protein
VNASRSFRCARGFPRHFTTDKQPDSLRGTLDAEEQVSGFSVVSAVSAACCLLFAFELKQLVAETADTTQISLTAP